MQKQIIDYINQYLLPCFLDTAKGFSIQTTLLYFIEKWNFTLDKKEYLGAILVDLSKAFNTIMNFKQRKLTSVDLVKKHLN